MTPGTTAAPIVRTLPDRRLPEPMFTPVDAPPDIEITAVDTGLPLGP